MFEAKISSKKLYLKKKTYQSIFEKNYDRKNYVRKIIIMYKNIILALKELC